MTEKPIEKYSFRKMRRKRGLVSGVRLILYTKLTIHLELSGRREYVHALPRRLGFSAAAMAPAMVELLEKSGLTARSACHLRVLNHIPTWLQYHRYLLAEWGSEVKV